MSFSHETYMQRALYLAQKGRFSTSPNPRVGAVIVHKGQIIGEGYHRKYGEVHAEPNAINAVKDKRLLPQSTLYVTLEPCSHHGKTPPCVDLILEHQIPKVYIASSDPFEKVNGSGIKKLQENGVKVTVGILKQESEAINKRFFTFHQKKRPYIILKWAETANGFIGRNAIDPDRSDNWITSSASRQLVHLWRAEEAGILIGMNTAEIDNPALTCREVAGKNPIRIVIDDQLSLSHDLKVFNQESQTIVFNEVKNDKAGHISYIKVDFSRKETVVKSILNELYSSGIQSLIVEGGSQSLQAFIDMELWDEARVFVGKKRFEKGVKAPNFMAVKVLSEKVDSDILTHYHRQ